MKILSLILIFLGASSGLAYEKSNQLKIHGHSAAAGDGGLLPASSIPVTSQTWTRDGSGVISPSTSTDNVQVSSLTVSGANFSVGGSTFQVQNGAVQISSLVVTAGSGIYYDAVFTASGPASNPQVFVGTNVSQSNGAPSVFSVVGHVVIRSSSTDPTALVLTISSAATVGTRQLMVIQNNGNVGIGNTAPVQVLQVAGTANATNFQTSGSLFNGTSSSNSRFIPGVNGATIDRNQNADTNTKAVLVVANLGTGTPDLTVFNNNTGTMSRVSNGGFILAASTASNGPMLTNAAFQVGGGTIAIIGGHWTSTSTLTPTLSACVGGSIDPNSNDMRGKITFGAGLTSCTINFRDTGGVGTPFCVCDEVSATTSLDCVPGVGTLQVNIAVGAANSFIYICQW